MPTLRIAFYKGRQRLFNRLIAWFLNGPYSHCELVLETVEGLSTCVSSSQSDGGVRLKKMALEPAHWDLVAVRGDTLVALRWLVAHEGNGYDLWGLLGFIGRRGEAAGNREFCSEAVAAMLGWPDPWRFDPMTLYAACVAEAADVPIHTV